MKAFAIIRHQKIKAGRHLVATGLHNARGIETPNADKAHTYAARVKALADKEAEEARDLIVMRDEALRRKEDASSAARLQLEVDREQLKALHLAAACERDALQKLRERLDSIMRKLECLVEPIVSYASRYRDAAPIIRQAMGAKGPAAATIAGSNEVAELETLPNLDAWLLGVEPAVEMQDPVPRPDWMTVPTGKEIGAYPKEDWLSGAHAAMSTLRYTPDGAVVLAELTSTISMDGNNEEESRMSVISHAMLPLGRLMPSMQRFGLHKDYVGREYPMVYGKPPFPSTVIAGGLPFCESDFVALNPVLGLHLGWDVAEDGLFRWVDAEGNVMAESLWWQEGNRSLHERSGMDEAASLGWLVMVSPEGWRQMLPAIQGFVVHGCAGRRIGAEDDDDGGDLLSVHVETWPLPV